MYKPCLETPNKRRKEFDASLCIVCNSNSTNRYFMTAPVLAQIYSDMEKQGGASNMNRKIHYQLGKAHTNRQNNWIASLLRTFDKHKVSLAGTEDEPFKNIITGQIFSNDIYDDLTISLSAF